MKNIIFKRGDVSLITVNFKKPVIDAMYQPSVTIFGYELIKGYYYEMGMFQKHKFIPTENHIIENNKVYHKPFLRIKSKHATVNKYFKNSMELEKYMIENQNYLFDLAETITIKDVE